jgi:hypothetical protein
VQAKIDSFKATLTLLLLSPLIGFLKPVFVSLMDQQAEFGSYSLAIAYSVWLSYLLNSGAYEGLLRRYTQFQEEGKSSQIMGFNDQVSSFWALILSFSLFLSILVSFLTEFYFFCGGFLLALSTTSFNIFSARLRVEGSIFLISLLHFVRLIVSLSLTFVLLTYTDLDLGMVLFLDALSLCLLNIVIFSTTARLGVYKRPFYKLYFDIAAAARNLTYISGLRAFCLLLERQSAGILFDEVAFSRYTQILLLFQAAIVAFGIIPQIWQRHIMWWTMKNGVREVLRYQIWFIVFVLTAWAAVWIIVYNYLPEHPFTAHMVTIFFVGAAGVCYGASFIDSILLGAKSNKGLIQVYSLTILCGFSILFVFVFNVEIWNLEYQACFLLLLSILVFVFPSLYLARQREK